MSFRVAQTCASHAELCQLKMLLPFAAFVIGASPVPAQSALEATQDLVISADKFGLRDIGSVFVSAKGVIVLPQFDEGRIAFFDPSGQLLGWVGRRGGGPGEFKGFSGSSGWKADTFVAIDASNSRITLISPSLKVLRMFPLPTALRPPTQPGGVAYPGMFFTLGVRPDNSLLAVVHTRKSGTPPAWLPVPANAAGFVSVALDGTLRRVATWIPELEDHPECTAVVITGSNSNGDVSSTTFPLPLCPREIIDNLSASMLGILILRLELGRNGSGYRILLVGSNKGDTLVNRRFTYTPIPIPKQVSDSIRTTMAARTAISPLLKTYYEKMPISKVYPPVAAIKLGLDGSIWLQEFGAPTGTQRWRVLDAKGIVVGLVTLRPDLRIKLVSRNAVWGVVADSDGFQSLVRYHIR